MAAKARAKRVAKRRGSIPKLEGVTRKVTLVGLSDMMFDRYAGDNKTQLAVEKKMYFDRDGMTMVMPAANLSSFLTAQNTPSAPKRLLDSRTYKKTAQAILSYTMISPHLVPLTRDGKPIVFEGFEGVAPDERCPSSGVYVNRAVARLEKGIPNPKVRPTLPTPWELEFQLHYFPNDEVSEEQIRDLMVRGGIAIGLGTWRGVFGKFHVAGWE